MTDWGTEQEKQTKLFERIADSLEVIEDTLLFFKGEWMEHRAEDEENMK